MKQFHMLYEHQRDLIEDWRSRLDYDNTILTPANFKALLDYTTSRDLHWQSLQKPVDMGVLNREPL